MPSYNEAKSVPRMVEEMAKVLPTIKDHQVELLYVDDSSPDGTADIVRGLQKKYSWLHLLVNPKKEGLGAAYAAGMPYAMKELKADWIMEMDADFQHPPADVPRLVTEINHGYDYIVASRYISGGSIPSAWSFQRKFLSVVGNLVARVFLVLPKIHDITGGFKLSRVKGFMDEFDFTTLLSKRFAYKIHLFFYMVQQGAKVKEVPFSFGNREEGESKIIKNEMQETLRVIFLLQWHNPKIRRFLKFGITGFLGFLVNSLALEFFRRGGIGEWLHSLTNLANASAWSGGLAGEMAIINNYLLNNFWTFKSQKITHVLIFLGKFIQFNLTSAGAVFIQFVVIGSATHFFGDTALVRQIALVSAIAFLIVPYNWFMYNTFIWKTKSLKARRSKQL